MSEAENQNVAALLGPEFIVSLDTIDPVSSPDEPREEYKPEKVVEIAVAMKLTGTSSDTIKVRKHPNAKSGYKWQRLAGGYRIAAAELLQTGVEPLTWLYMSGQEKAALPKVVEQWKQLPAKEYLGTPLQAAIYAAGDNINRSGHSTYEIAQLLAKTKAKYKLDTKQLIALLTENGFSAKYTEDYVNNLIRGYMKLCDTISQAWREDRGVSTNMINWIVMYPKKEQEELWTRILVAGKWETVKAEEDAKGTRKKRAPKHDRVVLGSSYVHDAISAVSFRRCRKRPRTSPWRCLTGSWAGRRNTLKSAVNPSPLANKRTSSASPERLSRKSPPCRSRCSPAAAW